MMELTSGETGGRETSTASVAGLPAGTVEVVPVRALLLGERLETRALERDQPLGVAPLTIDISEVGVAVLFRYGAVVVFGATSLALENFVGSLTPFVTAPLPVSERDEARLLIHPEAEQPVDLAGNIVLREKTTDRLQVVADVLAKGLILSHYETRIADIFDGIEPLAATLRETGRAGARGKELLRHIGDVLLMQQKMVGRVETGEKPELLWDHPELERLYVRLAEEYELRDRDRALDRKLDVISRTVETLLGLVQTRSSLRVEWYIVLLIVAELLLSTYPLLLSR
jgi:uncharacterized Rmd1/YagE family protein